MKKDVDRRGGIPSSHREGSHTMTTTTTTDNTMTTEQTEPPALILAVLNEEKTFIENMTIAGTVVDMYHLDDVMSGLYVPKIANRSENELIMKFGSYALKDMSKYFILHSIYLALSTYTRKSLIGSCVNNHIKKETGMDISLSKIKSSIRVSYPKKRKLFQCFGFLAYSSDNHFNVYGDECEPKDAVEFRIWIRSELDVIAKKLKLIEPGLKSLPEVMKKKVPYIRNTDKQI